MTIFVFPLFSLGNRFHSSELTWVFWSLVYVERSLQQTADFGGEDEIVPWLLVIERPAYPVF